MSIIKNQVKSFQIIELIIQIIIERERLSFEFDWYENCDWYSVTLWHAWTGHYLIVKSKPCGIDWRRKDLR